ncbi:HIT domain-containing protein [Pelagibius litoralis]|uniref:HIT domain-containing protein n=1 Tax=Pelagibius litoralis TaxID=374515 RepID=A0A967C363_9PROT|nr:HIT domain-containing protein [Pelagibius litoralis]NIA68888.1 HIT domain-containing protein [Pelagibius litoralis]
MTDDFVLHEGLAADCITLDDWPLCRVLLMNDATYPWLILVPRRPGLRDFHDVGAGDMPRFTDEIGKASRALQSAFKAEKMNLAALGNMVPQLHVHIIARFTSDPAWPGPIWGKVPAAPYEPGALQVRVDLLKEAFEET